MYIANTIKHKNKGARKRKRIIRRVKIILGTLVLFAIVNSTAIHIANLKVNSLHSVSVANAITAVDVYTQDDSMHQPAVVTQVADVSASVNHTDIPVTHVASQYSVTFRIAGDFMFARGVHKKFNKNPAVSLNKIGSDFFGGADASIVNLEGAIGATPLQKIAPSGSFSFIFPSTITDVLKRYGITTVSLANNHSLNNGWSGFKNTQKILSQNNIQYFGGPTKKYAPQVSIIKGTNLNLIVIGVHTLYETPDITTFIKKYKKNKNNRVLVMPHWGVEYQFKHNKRQERLAKQWIDAGTDLVVGAHPHVVQDTQVYKNVPIIYSLGNFLFDQTEKNTGEKGVQNGMTLHGKFIKDKLAIYGVPIEIKDFQPQLVKDNSKEAKILRDFYKPLIKHKQILNGREVYVFEK